MTSLADYPQQLHTLQTLIHKNTWPQAIIFYGPHGVEKNSIARFFIQQLICPHTQPDHCSECITRLDQHPDIHFIQLQDDETRISLGSVKHGIQHLYHTPFQASKKILCIDSAELLSPEGANALLKPIEDFHPNKHIFLLTTHLAGILPTIRSRAIHMSFLPISTQAFQPSADSLIHELQTFPRVILQKKVNRFSTIEHLHTQLSRLPTTQLKQLLTNQATEWQNTFLKECRVTNNPPKKHQLMKLAKYCETLPEAVKQHVSARSILEVLALSV